MVEQTNAALKSKSNVLGGKKTKKRDIVADSWEEDISSDSGADIDADNNGGLTVASRATATTTAHWTDPDAAKVSYDSSSSPLAGVPTQGRYGQMGNYDLYAPLPGKRNVSSSLSVRPEKQTAVASRLIAGALGIRAPKRTDEQRAYDRAIKEKEIKRRNRTKDEEAKIKEDEERVKSAFWND